MYIVLRGEVHIEKAAQRLAIPKVQKQSGTAISRKIALLVKARTLSSDNLDQTLENANLTTGAILGDSRLDRR